MEGNDVVGPCNPQSHGPRIYSPRVEIGDDSLPGRVATTNRQCIRFSIDRSFFLNNRRGMFAS
jgi:hypothetical protein